MSGTWEQGFYSGEQSGYDQQQQTAGYTQQSAPYGGEVQQGYNVGENYEEQQPFQQFDYSQSQPYEQNYSQQQEQQYMGQIMTPDPVSYSNPASGSGEDYENEPPLLEELGINFDHIQQKTLAVLNPLKQPDHVIMQDTDMAGPVLFCMAFGACLMLSGKLQFGYIYGIGVVGCMAMYGLLNLMSLQGVSISCIISVLGYCLLPMVLLSCTAVAFSLQGILGTIFTAVSVIWCSASASKLFVSALEMEKQQLLVAYPCALVYGVFALLTVF